MDESLVRRVRSFNRTVTQRIGALDERFLARGRPLGQARLLWEIGPDGSDLRSLRRRLDLDSGYLSRLLRALENDGLVVVDVHKADARVRSARLTAAGLTERALLDRLSDEHAAALLSALNDDQRTRLTTAMGEVERLMVASMVQMTVADPEQPSARGCIDAYVAELDRRFSGGFDPARSISASSDELRPPQGLLVVATLHLEPIGCGALKLHDDAPAEVKRMWIAPTARGLGLGRRLLAELEARAAAHGARTLRLETNRALTEAIALYRSAGYVEVEPFNDEPYADHWFEKTLTR